MSTHNRIKELRKEKGLSQKEFAKAFNEFSKDNKNVKSISYATVSRWENGENEPKLDTWLNLADFFNVSVPYLQGLSNSKATLSTLDSLIKLNGVKLSMIDSATDDRDLHTYRRITNAFRGVEKDAEIDPLKDQVLYRERKLEENIDPKYFIEFTNLFMRIYKYFLAGYGGKDDTAKKIYEGIVKASKNYHKYYKHNDDK